MGRGRGSAGAFRPARRLVAGPGALPVGARGVRHAAPALGRHGVQLVRRAQGSCPEASALGRRGCPGQGRAQAQGQGQRDPEEGRA
eukprot:14441892-Alexandrium_andersonii.AAC.1